MSPIKNPGRGAGLLYLLLILLAPLRLLVIPARLFVSGHASATAANVAAHETLFRLGMVADLACGTILIFLTLALYRLFQSVGRNLAVLMVIAGGILPSAIDFFNVANDAAALLFVRGGEFLGVFDKAQRDAMALMFLRLHHQVILGAEILWGLWLFPLGRLAIRSGFLPPWLGYWLIANGVVYLITSLTGLLLPRYEDLVSLVVLPAQLGEVAFMLWLVIRGVKAETVAAAALPAQPAR